jgi:hypothetical protein
MKRNINVIGIDIAKRVFHVIAYRQNTQTRHLRFPPHHYQPCRYLRRGVYDHVHRQKADFCHRSFHYP